MSNAPKHTVTGAVTWSPALGGGGLTGLFYVDGRLTSDYNTGSDLFVEKALWGDYSIRFDAYNVNGAKEYKTRILYAYSQLDGVVARTETFVEARDRRFAIRLRGKF